MTVVSPFFADSGTAKSNENSMDCLYPLFSGVNFVLLTVILTVSAETIWVEKIPPKNTSRIANNFLNLAIFGSSIFYDSVILKYLLLFLYNPLTLFASAFTLLANTPEPNNTKSGVNR
ncbi:Uncharacterised protein [Streptococcus suis]|uniref:Uncharacterized protein n=1 Tax=Streptococcus suis TaxID=1307 RepID=A0A0Z8LA00_STRSU|nr:Uncharacterised protein [Streptococcus suis]CYV86610.1 Uncharacterised protein [Streptococcus suis]